jgi:superfamily II DNA or RNA helicase
VYQRQPLIIASATPNYNDVERCYCIQRIVDPSSTQGGYMAFLYKHCDVDVNPWGHVPRVNGFTKYPDAATFLQDMRNVEFIEDNLTYTIDDVTLTLPVPGDLLTYGIDRRNERVIGSQIEEKHRLIEHALVTESGELAPAALELVLKIVFDSPTPTLIFAVHTSVVSATVASLLDAGVVAVGVTGKTRPDLKAEAVDAFRSGQLQALVGTVTLATGTDGLDKMCDTLLILDDTEDDAMRRQLIGRIMPRGHAAVVAHNNRVVRLVSDITAAP